MVFFYRDYEREVDKTEKSVRCNLVIISIKVYIILVHIAPQYSDRVPSLRKR